MYVLVKADVDHENVTVVSLVAASDDLAEMQRRMYVEHSREMAQPSPKWVEEWDELYSGSTEFDAECGIETSERAIVWHIFDTNNEVDSFEFI